jgi:hypothetical protein
VLLGLVYVALWFKARAWDKAGPRVPHHVELAGALDGETEEKTKDGAASAADTSTHKHSVTAQYMA